MVQPGIKNNLSAILYNEKINKTAALHFKIMDMTGKTLYSYTGNANSIEKTIERLYLPAAIYIVQALTEDGAISLNKKIVTLK